MTYQKERKRLYFVQCEMQCGRTGRLEKPVKWICDECESKHKRKTDPAIPSLMPTVKP